LGKNTQVKSSRKVYIGGSIMRSNIFFACVKTTTITSDMPNGSQKDNEATSFVGQYSMLCVSKIAVGIACGV